MTKLSTLLWLTLVACHEAAVPNDAGKTPRVFAQGAAALGDGDRVRVKGVVKGDELVVEKAGKQARVRLVGIYAFSAVLNDPQVHALAAGAVSTLEDLVGGHDITLTLSDPPADSTGRTLAYVDLNGIDVNRRLIETGWAVVYTEFPFAREGDYQRAEDEARGAGRNLWGLKTAAEMAGKLRGQWNQSRASKQAR